MDCHLFVQNLEQITAKQPSKNTGQQNSAKLTGTAGSLLLTDNCRWWWSCKASCWLVQDSKVS